jgi:predicted RNA-binding protein Jag
MERRIVHMALSEEEGITTESTGEGGIRRVQILPERSQG